MLQSQKIFHYTLQKHLEQLIMSIVLSHSLSSHSSLSLCSLARSITHSWRHLSQLEFRAVVFKKGWLELGHCSPPSPRNHVQQQRKLQYYITHLFNVECMYKIHEIRNWKWETEIGKEKWKKRKAERGWNVSAHTKEDLTAGNKKGVILITYSAVWAELFLQFRTNCSESIKLFNPKEKFSVTFRASGPCVPLMKTGHIYQRFMLSRGAH